MTETAHPSTTTCLWLQLQLPASTTALAPLQALLQVQAQAHGFDPATLQRMRAACDEALSTVLRLGHDTGEDANNLLQVYINVENAALQLRLSDNGLPYDLSLLPQYSPHKPEAASEDAAGLSAFLMQKLADRCQVLNYGQQGHHVLLQWMLPQNTAAAPPGQDPPALSTEAPAVAAPSAAPATIRPMQPEDAIHLARLMFRTFGYSYTNPDMYTAEGIQTRLHDGRLTSWVAIPADGGAPVGHIALLKAHGDDATVEIGTAVVSPSERGSGLFTRLVATVEAALQKRHEHVAFLHAVAAHPFTQKTFNHLGYHPTALLLGLIPGSAHFRGMAGRKQGERVSAFHSCKLLRPVDPQPVYLPAALRPLILPRAQAIGLPLVPLPLDDVQPQGVSVLDWQIEESMGAAFLTLRHAGDDLHSELPRQLRKLCRAQIDVIYLHLDLSQAATPAAWSMAQKLGFIPAGLTPFMPWPATLCLQYLNNQTLHEHSVCAVGSDAEILRAAAFAAYRARELL